ncbi:MAG: glycosyltransferase [Moorea sp. SIO4E2]|uniref:glycosyltransferase family 39 protein n=1 Tax=Moorena sp. SIO4E2 TaxID=2607826 RepID=UPI0013BA584E|nr:hypothetical protein [Moorena sp. SIO4E2]NEQ07619.1 glycosyltransferase [Moorena sp. SIO4E2]
MILNNPKSQVDKSWSSWVIVLLLLVWIAIAAGLRFTYLAGKPPWSDEFATLVFSLGNSFRRVPLDQVITSDTLLAPLKPNSSASINSVINNLITESNHPPLYFVLTHLWLKLFPGHGELVSLWVARSLSVLLGVISIPALFGLGCLGFRSSLVGHFAAALMAVSPYGIYLAQEARHYTLGILLVIASVSCLVYATRSLQRQTPFPIYIALIWVIVNSLGIAVHYFFVLVIAAVGLVMLGLRIGSGGSVFSWKYWWRIYAVALGTLMGVLVWLPILPRPSSNRLTEWVHQDTTLSNLLEPVARLLSWLITMVVMLPVEGQSLPIMVASGLVTVILVVLIVQLLRRGIRIQSLDSQTKVMTQVLGGFVLGAIALFLLITYGLGIDLTLAARYQFVYFPMVIMLLAASFASCWRAAQGKDQQWVALILLMGLVGGVIVASHVSYQKADRPDLAIAKILEISDFQSQSLPVLIATVHKSHEQTGEMMGLAWELNRRKVVDTAINSPQFLLAHKDTEPRVATETLQKTVAQLPKPLELWVVNFSASVELKAQGCIKDKQSISKVPGYRFRRYSCEKHGAEGRK